MQMLTNRSGSLFRIYKQLSGGEQLLDRRLHITSLGGACKRSHIDRFKSCIADLALRKFLGDCFGHDVDPIVRDEDSANRGTFLPCLDGHFLHDLLHHQVPFGITCLNIGTEQGGIERIGLGINRYRTMNDIRMRTKQTSGVS